MRHLHALLWTLTNSFDCHCGNSKFGSSLSATATVNSDRVFMPPFAHMIVDFDEPFRAPPWQLQTWAILVCYRHGE